MYLKNIPGFCHNFYNSYLVPLSFCKFLSYLRDIRRHNLKTQGHSSVSYSISITDVNICLHHFLLSEIPNLSLEVEEEILTIISVGHTKSSH